jgi:hypothetical protein
MPKIGTSQVLNKNFVMFIPSQVSVSMFMSMPMCASVAMPLYVAVLMSLFKPGAFAVLCSCSLFTFKFTFVFLFQFPSVAFPQSSSYVLPVPGQVTLSKLAPRHFVPWTIRPKDHSPHGHFAPWRIFSRTFASRTFRRDDRTK